MKIYLAGSLHTDELKTNIKTVVTFYAVKKMKYTHLWN
jgi:hypothetical protein